MLLKGKAPVGLDSSDSLLSCQEAQGPAGSGMDPQHRPELHPICAAATLVLFLVPTGKIPDFPPYTFYGTAHKIRMWIYQEQGSWNKAFGSLAHSTGWECEQGGSWAGGLALMTGSLYLLAEDKVESFEKLCTFTTLQVWN